MTVQNRHLKQLLQMIIHQTRHGRKTLLTIAILIVLTSFSNSINGQVQSDLENNLFGIKLSSEVQSLLSNIEHLYGKEVQQKWLIDRRLSGTTGQAYVTRDGSPVVSIDSIHGRNLETIAHELYHLLLMYNGYPSLILSYPKSLNKIERSKIGSDLYDPILHYLFFDTLRSWGINPTGFGEEILLKMINDNEVKQMEDIPMWYFKYKLEGYDPTLMNNFRGHLLEAHKDKELEFGDSLYQIVIDSKPVNPDEVINVLLKYLNLYYENQYYFTDLKWSAEPRGKFQRKWVTIYIKPILK